MHDTLSSLVERALMGSPRPLEFYLREHSRLPGPRANLELANDVGYLLAAAIPTNENGVRTLVNYFSNGDRKMVASNTPAEYVMLCGLIAAGICAAAYPEWREETYKLLSHYACSPYWRVRESVTTAYQHLLTTDPAAVLSHLYTLAREGNQLQQRAAVTAIAEPRLLYTPTLLTDALDLQRIVLLRQHQVPLGERKVEDFRVLKRALGYTLSVITAAAPEQGFALMRECASWEDTDIAWVLRENLKKKRLAKFVQDTAAVASMLPSV
ncbi:MAG TPA: hypothetical protein VKX46_00700 [Ktedonobacteraceae bacterium]|nr:hypothetical protein [Ktedonobacteraceae bacterium]